VTWTRALVYVALWAALSAYYLMVEYERSAITDASEADTVPQVQFLPVTAANVAAVEIQAHGVRGRFVRSGDRWQIAEPPGKQVPADLIAAIVSAVTERAELEIVNSGDAPSADFGLASAATQLALYQADGSVIRVLLGARNPAQTAVYARREGKPDVVLLGLNVQYYIELVIEALQRPPA